MQKESVCEVSAESRRTCEWIRTLRFGSGLTFFVYLAGIGVLLFYRLDYWLVALYFLQSLNSGKIAAVIYNLRKSLSGTDRLANESEKLKSSQKKLKYNLYILSKAVLASLILLWVISALQNPAKFSGAAAWLFVFAAITLINHLIVFSSSKLVRLKSASLSFDMFIPVNVILWKFGVLNRSGLVYVFCAEAVAVLMIAVVNYLRFNPKNEISQSATLHNKLNKLSKLGDLSKLAEKSKYSHELALKAFIRAKCGKEESSFFSHSTEVGANGEEKPVWNISLCFSNEVCEKHPRLEQEIRDFLSSNFPAEYADLREINIHWE